MHKSDAGDIAAIAILYQYGAPDSFYFQVQTHYTTLCLQFSIIHKLRPDDELNACVQLKNKLIELAKDKETCNFAEEVSQVPAGVIHMRSLQKRTGSYFRYMGSLTTPPCTENVIWNILGKVRQISKEQVALLEALMPAKHTARPPQPLNGRVVQFYNPPNSTISFQM